MHQHLSQRLTVLFHRLIGAIRKAYPDIPIHVHSHDTAGIAAVSMIAAAAAGADVVDVAIDSTLNFITRKEYYKCCLFLRYVWTDFATFNGGSLYGIRADGSRNRNSL